ncbi:MAG: PIG-L family deacetylase [Patescibacteria group bacterium]|nr:PIG-L family deacetylase [Patescibacteria group bacterium]
MFNNFKKILILAPHTDDGEFGCGGTIAKLIKGGKKIYYVAFSTCEASVPKDFPKDILKKELKQATKTLGIKSKNLTILNYPVRHFPQNRQAILEDMIKLKNKIVPDLIFMPSLHDIHQDHLTIAQEGLRAFKQSSILGYEDVWNNLTFNTICFVHLTELIIKKKIEAIKKYKSQSKKLYATAKFIRSLAHVRGIQIGTEYAEAFEVIRWIIN